MSARSSDNSAASLDQWVDALLALPVEERADAAREFCGGDEALLARLLEAVSQAGQDDLERRLHEMEITGSFDDGFGEAQPERIGPYRLLERLGEGGFGLVFIAEQTDPVKRKVAIKIIKPGMDSRQIIARFEAERQALALMEHPNIARVFDASATETGRPYFVMELVRGVPITDYCDTNHLPLKSRLELFITVCHAIQHAHHKGIIHRDIKPSNVLVSSHDGNPVAKVIDFGVAKALHHRLTERTIYTHSAQMIGTPLYMSPEQAEMGGLDIDTRSDIYSLGILLYELLTGVTPLERKFLVDASLDEIRRAIRDETPPKPSTRLRKSEDLTTIVVRGHAEPARLSKLVRGDLDWVVMKALEKDRTRRYETAIGLARDIERYLADEPVEACPPSAAYRLRKFGRKHRAQLTVVAAILALLITGTVVSTWQAVRATQAEHAALSAKQEAEKRLAQIEKSNAIITGIFTDLDMLRVNKGNEPLSAILAERLVQAAEQLEGESVGDPLEVARLQIRLGRSLVTLGATLSAIPLFEKASATRTALLGPDHALTLSATTGLVRVYLSAGQVELAYALCQENLRRTQARFASDHNLTLQAMADMADWYWAAQKLDLALPLYEETHRRILAKRGPEHPATLVSQAMLAFGYKEAGKQDLAIPLFEETLQLMKSVFGVSQPYTLNTQVALAMSYRAAGKLDMAVPLAEEDLRLSDAKLGSGHTDTLFCMNALAECYRDAGKNDLALPLFKAAAEGMEKRRFQHWDAANIVNNLINCYDALGQVEQAEAWRAKWIVERPDHPERKPIGIP